MKGILLLVIIFISTFSFAKVEMKSIYFIRNSDATTEYSQEALMKLKDLIQKMQLQVIEINSFTSNGGKLDDSITLSEERIVCIVNTLGIDENNITINAYGNRRVELNFKPVSWDRVDVYYNIDPKVSISTSDSIGHIKLIDHVDLKEPEELKITFIPNEVKPDLIVPELIDIVENVPIVLPINFKGGTDIIVPEDQLYLQHLFNTLDKYKNLNAHIRGHVCCEKNKSGSKKRAKVVYDYLVNKGIDKNRLSYKGYSNTQPIVFPEKNNADRAQNRRVDIVFEKK
jgi:outer membrane protein OmpA-like peptidoglycan-associated protein